MIKPAHRWNRPTGAASIPGLCLAGLCLAGLCLAGCTDGSGAPEAHDMAGPCDMADPCAHVPAAFRSHPDCDSSECRVVRDN